MSLAPQTPSAERSAPAKFCEPSSTRAGPSRISLSVALVPTWMRVPRGRLGSGVAMPQLKPLDADSSAPASGVPIITASAPRRERLADVGADAHAAVGDDRDAHAASPHVLVTRGRDIGRGSHLRHADAEHASCRACGARTDADQDARDAGLHQLERRLVMDAVADDDRDVACPDQLLERELVVRLGRMPRGEHCALDDKDVGACLLNDLGALLGSRRDCRDRTRHAGSLDRVDALRDELGLDRLAIDLFEDGVDVRLVRLGDSLDDRRGVLVAGVDAVEVQHRQCRRACPSRWRTRRRPRRPSPHPRSGSEA